jgi:hypothetical protein
MGKSPTTGEIFPTPEAVDRSSLERVTERTDLWK